ncbi:alpha/beta hydrolase [Deminuibacter soli]|uniref:Phospholipase n=1 Tax=Deminuibacter soli TaxID=2291815 RepID=A0A3E1NP30_9BACT|nr:dienelactone hydrolase family protein [Deminuibacter soli]RFM29670.1 phospholipase [Deminuibacter soli]
MHEENILFAGAGIKKNGKVLIMLHGRGSSAEDILSLATYLDVNEFALAAPQATGGSWYPRSFLAPPEQNEPALSDALTMLHALVADFETKGIRKQDMYFLGFSQGACLALEFITRNATRYGGVIAFTGGLIGDKIYRDHYKGDFAQTPVFIGTSDPDFHVPVERVYATANILNEMGAAVTEKVYANMGHTINQDEITMANTLILNAGQ